MNKQKYYYRKPDGRCIVSFSNINKNGYKQISKTEFDTWYAVAYPEFYYYKSKDEQGWLNLKSPDFDSDPNYIKITEQEFNEHLQESE